MDGRFIVVHVGSTDSSEEHVVDMTAPGAPLRCVAPRADDVLYSVHPLHDTLVILTNLGGATNQRLMVCPVDGDTAMASWKEVVPHSDARRLDDVTVFSNGTIVLEGRNCAEALTCVWTTRGPDWHLKPLQLPRGDPVYDLCVGANYDFSATTFRCVYSSLRTPTMWLDVALDDHAAVTVKQQPVPGHNPDDYEVHREWATGSVGFSF